MSENTTLQKAYTVSKETIDELYNKLNGDNYTAKEIQDYYAHLMACKAEYISFFYSFICNHPKLKRKRQKTKEEMAAKMFKDTLNRLAYAADDGMMWSPFTETIEQAIGRIVSELTDEKIQQHINKKKKEREAKEKIINNPETLYELRAKANTPGIELTPKEAERLDELTALDIKEKKQRNQEKQVEMARETVRNERFSISKDKHTKTGSDIWIVKLVERVEKQEFYDIKRQMSRLGGYYSRFSRGFIFDKDPTSHLTNGDVDASVQEKEGTVPEKFRNMAKTMQKEIEEKRNDDRLTNTARRQAQDASARMEADRLERIKKIMLRIADALEEKKLIHLSEIHARTHIETLERLLYQAKIRADKENNVRWEITSEREVKKEDIHYANYPMPETHYDNLIKLISGTKGMTGTVQAARRIEKFIKQRNKDSYLINFLSVYEDVEKLMQIGKNMTQVRDVVSRINDDLADRKRIRAMGLNCIEQLRAALREYLIYRKGSEKSAEEKNTDVVRKMEQTAVLSKIEGFFPTPKTLAEELVRRADIQKGERILEPSAGKANIAAAIKERYPENELHVVEYNHSLREILTAKGYTLVGQDFLAFTDTYDKIIMNPPFERGQDIKHVQHAYNLLNDDGKLVAIMSEGPFYRSDKQSVAFRDWLEEVNGTSEKLPEAFEKAERSTGVSARLVCISKLIKESKDKQEEEVPLIEKPLAEKVKPSADNQLELEPYEITQFDYTQAARDEFYRIRSLPENDMAIVSGVSRKPMTEKQRIKFDNRLARNSCLPALDEWNNLKAKHEASVRKAVRDGVLDKDRYIFLHAETYGDYDEFKAPTSQELAAEKHKKIEERKIALKKKVQENIANMLPGGKVRHAGMGLVGEVVKVNQKSFRVKIQGSGSHDTWPKDIIDVATLPEIQETGNTTEESISVSNTSENEEMCSSTVAYAPQKIKEYNKKVKPKERISEAQLIFAI